MKYIFTILVIILFVLPVYSESNFETGKKFFDNNNFLKAKDFFEKDLTGEKKSDKRVLSLYYLGRTFEKLGNKEKSIEIYSKVIKEYPDNYLAEHSTNRIKQLNPQKEIDYKRLSSKESSNKLQADNKSSSISGKKKNSVKSNSKELIKQSYSYDNVLQEKDTLNKNNIQKKIKEDIEILTKKENQSDTVKKNDFNVIFEKNKDEKFVGVQQDTLTFIDTFVAIAKPVIEDTSSTSSPIKKEPIKYTVKKNDTLFSISNQFYGNGSYFSLLKEYNRLANITSIYEGLDIYIPQNPNEISEIPEYVYNKQSVPKNDNNSISANEDIFLKEDKPELTNIFISANEKLKKNLYIDSLMDFKNYMLNGKNKIKLETAYYKIAEINHILGYFNDAVSAYLAYISKFDGSENIARACYNLANIYNQGLGLYVPAKQYYLLALDKTDNIELISMIKDNIQEIENSQSEFEKAKKEKDRIENEIKLTEKLMEEKGVIAETEIDNIKKQYKVAILPSELEKSNITEKKLQSITPDFKQIEPVAQKGRNKNIQEIIEDKKNAQYYNEEGYKYKNIGMYEEAVKSYKQAIESFPDDPIAYNNIAYLYADMGVNLEEALRYAETSIKLDPNNRGYYFDTLGWIYYRMNDFTRAKEFLEKSVFYNPSAIRKYHLAQVYKKLNMKDKALIELQGAQVIQPIGKLAEQVKNEIYELQN
ncbi:tetratricopeptide repeat protein [Candidatus Dependentiae bacterium]|nr:tetratricopeptide repeat protein [Candidatus Dependentiae bacterium]